ncbi:DUF602-domain-containing protein [Polyplosphaeria fusca]|uniref:DUF602-domain-containing protein n=1 Tax=Polyplosphaeria fusca TaxID=682080 RepID=A0A9P4V3B5_9PLEO|nr:DUF602-domain-containing protein [Polyplosphaeria fusca]
MGNDGGSIPTRRELVKEAAKALTTTQVKEVQSEQQEYAWSHDPLSQKALARPVVSDSAGTLYNKESILEYLLNTEDDATKAEADKVLDGRVKSLKDVIEVKFEVEEGQREGASTGRTEKWICPITRTELGPGSKAVYIVPCGHAFAGSVVKEVSGETCLQCNEPYASNDIIPIVPIVPTDIARLTLRAKTLKEKGLTHSLKDAAGKKKKRKHADREANGETNGTTNGTASKAKDSTSEEDKKEKERKPKQVPAASDGIKNASTAYLTKKVLAEQEEKNKRRKLQQNENVKSLFSKGNRVPDAKNSADYMTRGFSFGK